MCSLALPATGSGTGPSVRTALVIGGRGLAPFANGLVHKGQGGSCGAVSRSPLRGGQGLGVVGDACSQASSAAVSNLARRSSPSGSPPSGPGNQEPPDRIAVHWASVGLGGLNHRNVRCACGRSGPNRQRLAPGLRGVYRHPAVPGVGYQGLTGASAAAARPVGRKPAALSCILRVEMRS